MRAATISRPTFLVLVSVLGLLLGAASPASAQNNYFYTNDGSCIGSVTDLNPPLEGLLSEKSSFSFAYGTFNQIFGPFEDPDLDVPPGDSRAAYDILEETAAFYLETGAGRDCVGPEGRPSGRFLIPWNVFTVSEGQMVSVERMRFDFDNWENENEEPVNPDAAFWWIKYTEAGEGNEAPTADAGDPVASKVGASVTFDGSGSSDPDGTIQSYLWDFGDGSSSNVNPASHTYDTPGLYNVTLTVTDNDGAPASDVTSADIGASQPPVADAGGPYIGTPGLPVFFDGSSSSDPDSGIDEYVWDPGDGSNPKFGSMPTHIYDFPGSYVVTLRVGSGDETDVDVALVRVGLGNPPPVADAGGPTYRGQADVPVAFDGTGSNDPGGMIEFYEWSFGDGSRGFEATPDHTYDRPGIYNATLTVTDVNGAQDSDSATVIIEMQEGNQPPDCSLAVPSRSSIWPANRRFVPIRIEQVFDPDLDPVSITIDSIFQNEPVFFVPDGRGVGTDTAFVRAERFRFGFGRVYVIGFTADDGQGQSCSGEVLVDVPLRRGDDVEDESGGFDSTMPFLPWRP